MTDPPPPPGPVAAAPPLATAAHWMILLVGGVFLLRELGDILKPLCLAVLLGYIILPLHFQVKKYFPGRFSLVASAVLSLTALFVLTAVVQSSVRTLAAEVPLLRQRTQETLDHLQTEYAARYPETWRTVSEFAFPEREGDSYVRDVTGRLFGMTANTVGTGAVVGLYLLFLLVEAGKFPDRVRRTYPGPRAERILETIEGINRGVAHYLTAKVKSSLILAVPVFVLLAGFRVDLFVLWAVLTFFCNFVPYLGSLIGYSLPTMFAAYQFGFGWEAITIAILLLAIHLVCASIVEPKVIGQAVGLSPVVILFALAFWGYCWGLTGMLLAVPLTVMLKIIAIHVDATKSLARLVSEE